MLLRHVVLHELGKLDHLLLIGAVGVGGDYTVGAVLTARVPEVLVLGGVGQEPPACLRQLLVAALNQGPHAGIVDQAGAQCPHLDVAILGLEGLEDVHAPGDFEGGVLRVID